MSSGFKADATFCKNLTDKLKDKAILLKLVKDELVVHKEIALKKKAKKPEEIKDAQEEFAQFVSKLNQYLNDKPDASSADDKKSISVDDKKSISVDDKKSISVDDKKSISVDEDVSAVEDKPTAGFILYDFLTQKDGNVVNTKPIFISWVPDEAARVERMKYASSLSDISKSFAVSKVIQANDLDDLDYTEIAAKF